jgi:hypothetical protein
VTRRAKSVSSAGASRASSASKPKRTRSGKASFNWLAGSLIVLAAILRFYHLATQEIWLDEAFSGLLVQRPAMLPLIASESNPPLYWLILKGFCSVFGNRPEVLRALSALFSAVSVAVVTFYAARVVNRRFALGAGLFLALSPYSLYYAQEARAYSLLILLSLVMLLSCYHAVTQKSRAAVVAFALSVLAAGFTHYLVAFTLLPLTLWLIARVRQRPDERNVIRWLLISMAAAAGLCALWAAPSFLRQGTSDPHLWLVDEWRHVDKLWLVPRSLLVLLLGSAEGLTPLFMKQWTTLIQPVGLVIAALGAFAVGLTLALRDGRGFGGRHASHLEDEPPGIAAAGGASKSGGAGGVVGPPAAVGCPAAVDPTGSLGWLLLAAILLSLGTLFAVSFLKPLYVVARYDVVAFGYVVLLCGWIGDRVATLVPSSRHIGWTAAAAFLSCLGYKDQLYYASPSVFHDHDAQVTARLLDDYVGVQDAVVLTGMRGPSVLYYLSALGYQWDGQYCSDSARGRVFECHVLPYTDTGAPFVMGGTVTTPVTADSAVADLQPLLARKTRPVVWLALSLQREPVNELINRHLEVLLHRYGYGARLPSPELTRYQVLKYQPTGVARVAVNSTE